MKISTTQLTRLAIDVLSRKGRLNFEAVGSSMCPTICPGDIITIESVDINSLAVGDIIFFSSREKLLVHTLVAMRRQGKSRLLTTRGDAHDDNDEPINEEAIIGRVVHIKPCLISYKYRNLPKRIISKFLNKTGQIL